MNEYLIKYSIPGSPENSYFHTTLEADSEEDARTAFALICAADIVSIQQK